MTYGVVVTMADSVETYDAIHTELLRTTPGPATGLLVHVGRATPEGFEVVEVWESPELAERYNREVVWPVTERVTAGRGRSRPVVEEFDVHGLVIPPAGVAW